MLEEKKKRRPKGSGTVRKLGNGTVEYIVSIGTNAYGERVFERFYGSSEADCIRKYRQRLKEIGERKKSLGTEYTLGQWLDRWLESYTGKRIARGEKQIAQSTIDEYKKLAARIKKYKISKLKLTDIKPLILKDFFFKDLSGYGYSTVKKTRFLLNAAFEEAIDNDFCFKNPMKNIAIPQIPPQEKVPFDRSEVMAIYRHAVTGDEFGLCMLILLGTGVRPQEFRALKGTDFDLDRLSLTISRAIKETGEEGVTKTRKPRIIPIQPSLARHLRSKISKDYIFGGEHFAARDTFRSSYEAFFNRMNKQRAKQGKPPLKVLPPQSCRHTYSTELQARGVPIEIVSSLLGHSNLKTTEGYTHLNNIDVLRAAIDRAK